MKKTRGEGPDISRSDLLFAKFEFISFMALTMSDLRQIYSKMEKILEMIFIRWDDDPTR